jgi:uncharacterized protein (DUF934 family)
MKLIRLIDGKPGTVADQWVHVADGEALPEGAAATVGLERWRAERDSLSRRNLPVGVRLRSDDRPEAIAGDLARLALVAVDFPTLDDGRGYSTARLLRERHGFAGELRATGQVLRDQLDQMARCGFDSFELANGADGALSAFGELAVVYQPAADSRATAGVLRSLA